MNTYLSNDLVGLIRLYQTNNYNHIALFDNTLYICRYDGVLLKGNYNLNNFVKIPTPNNVVSVATNHDFTLILLVDGRVLVERNNKLTHVANNVISIVGSLGGSEYRILFADGTVSSVRYSARLLVEKIPNIINIIDIAFGTNHQLMIRADEENILMGNGTNSSYQLGLTEMFINTPTRIPLTEVPVSIACGAFYSLVLLENGTISGSGLLYQDGEPIKSFTKISRFANVKRIFPEPFNWFVYCYDPIIKSNVLLNKDNKIVYKGDIIDMKLIKYGYDYAQILVLTGTQLLLIDRSTLATTDVSDKIAI